MTKYRTAAWGLAGLLSLTAGLRNIFAPGFLSMSPRPADNIDTVLCIVVGVICLAMALYQAVKARGGRGVARA